MANVTESLPSADGGSARCAGRRKRAQWLIPLALLALFVVTALASRIVDSARLGGRRAAASDLGATPVQGGVFRYPLFQPVHTLDPAQAVFSVDVMLVQQLYDGLTAFDQHLNVVPAIAKFWEISPDGRTYTFELRENARFHDGRKVTADDCVFSFERLLTPGLNEHNYHYFSRIEGATEFHEGRARHVSGLRAVNPSTFQISFVTPFVPALSVLSMYSSKILPKEELQEAGDAAFFRAPIGTGAFQFARWVGPPEDPSVPVVDGVRQGLRLEANLAYFEGRPHLDALVFRAIWNSKDFEGESRPLNEVADCLETNDVERYADWVSVEADRLLALRYLYFPNHVPPYDDPRVRRAINYALDKRSFLDSHRVTAGIPAATGVVPPGIPGFVPKESHYRKDLETARELLREAGYPGGKGLPPLELPVLRNAYLPMDPGTEAKEGCLVSCLREVGVEVRVVRTKRVVTPDDPSFRGRAILRENTWYADFPDPDNFLRPLFHSTGYMNQFGYENPEVDRLLDQVWSETSYTTRNKLYHRIEAQILEDAPIIPTDYGRLRYLLRPNVRGFKLSPLGAPYIKMKNIWLAEEGPASEVEL
jgi:peptide/nickel transport system substrate-binding protein/oligopeptide transport system substrate-binding protein